MRARVQRFKETAIGTALRDIIHNQQYNIELSSPMRQRIRNGAFDRILFVGYGCSSAPIEVLRALFDAKGIKLPIMSLSAHNFDSIYYQTLVQPSTLVIVSSFSGNTKECVMAYEHLSRGFPDNVIVMTSGGTLYERAPERVRWAIERMDREYPIFHLPQIVAILLHLFYELGFIPTDFANEYQSIAPDSGLEQRGSELGSQLRGFPISLIYPYTSCFLARIMAVYLSEIAMIKADMVDIHEFGHVYVAACTRMIAPHGFLLFEDACGDAHTLARYRSVTATLQNRNCVLTSISLPKAPFFQRFIDGMTLCNWAVFDLAAHYDIPDENLISGIVKNSAYVCKEVG